jgi:hypothetical protein
MLPSPFLFVYPFGREALDSIGLFSSQQNRYRGLCLQCYSNQHTQILRVRKPHRTSVQSHTDYIFSTRTDSPLGLPLHSIHLFHTNKLTSLTTNLHQCSHQRVSHIPANQTVFHISLNHLHSMPRPITGGCNLNMHSKQYLVSRRTLRDFTSWLYPGSFIACLWRG